MNAGSSTRPVFSDLEHAAFNRDGFVVRRKLASGQQCADLLTVSKAHLSEQLAPIEYEIDVHYPGAPRAIDDGGAQTSRRLLQAYSRHQVYRDWATSSVLTDVLLNLFRPQKLAVGADETGDGYVADNVNAPGILLSQCHHNCVMTKQAGFSSATLWHQDNRYWSFDQQNLISVWLALDTESRKNGCLRVIPGTHKMEFDPGRFDAKLFLRPDLTQNKVLLKKAQLVELERGDVLFFHSRLFHAAGRNLTEQTKYSAVFTYHQSSNHPISGTRSAKFPSIRL